MIELLSLKFQNIGRFVDMQTIDFSKKSKLLQFDGKNENTGGSSGSGKSTVFHAIDLLFGVNELPVSSLQSRLTKNGFFVEGQLLIKGVPVTVTRSKKDGLTVTTPTETIEGNAKIAEERLALLLGIPKKLFRKMIHKSQKSGGFFLELTAKESYQFMMECLDQKEWEEKSEKLALKIKDLESSSTQVESSIARANQLLAQYTTDLAAVQKPEVINQESLEKSISVLKESLKAAEEKIALTKAKLDKDKSDLLQQKVQSIPPKPVVEGDENLSILSDQLKDLALLEAKEIQALGISEISSKISNAQSAIVDIEKKQSQVESLVAQTLDLTKQHKHLTDAQCPTCSQTWVGDSATKKIENLNAQIQENKKKILEFKALAERLPVVKKALEDLKAKEQEALSEKTKISVKYANNKSEINSLISNIDNTKKQKILEWNSQVQAIELDYMKKIKVREEAAELDLCVALESKNTSQSEIKNLESIIQNYNSKLKYYDEITTSTKSRMSEVQSNLKELNKNLLDIKKQALVAAEAQRAIKNYTLQIFQDTLDFIGQYATQILNAVPAMASATLFFENCKETQSGKIKDEINCVINIDGENDINIKTLSGGERTAVDLAVDLAVIEVLESELGIGASFIILDEPFTGLDSIGCEAVIDIIKQIGIKKQIVMVDHNEAVKQIIEETITIQRKGLESIVLNGQ